MDRRGTTGRLAVGVVMALLMGGCAGSATSPPPPSSPPASSPSSGTPSPAAATKAPDVDLGGLSVGVFALGVTTNAFFAVDATGNLYLPGGSEGAALVKVAPDGAILARWAGLEVVEGVPDTVVGIAIEPGTGDVFVADTSADKVVHLAPDLTVQESWGSTGTEPGQFISPGGVAFDPQGRLLVADVGNDRVQVFSRDGTVGDAWDAPGGTTALAGLTTDLDGNVYVSAWQPLILGVSAGELVKLAPDGSPALTLEQVNGSTLTYPDTAVDADGNIYVADAWLGLLKLSPSGEQLATWKIPGGGNAAVAVRVAPSGSIYTLACDPAGGRCEIAAFTPDGKPLAAWHASTEASHPGAKIDVGGHGLYLQCAGTGSPTIVWEAGAFGSGRLETAQYLMGRLSRIGRVCVYDRAGLGLSDPGPDEEFTNWAQTVDDLHTLLQKGDVPGPYVLAGYSYGGLLAKVFAYTYPGEVSGLVLIDPANEDEFAGPVDPMAPYGITSCTDSTCPVFDDIAAVHALTKGKVAGSLGALPLVVLSHSPDHPFWAPEYDAYWLELGTETATASSNAVHVVASRSSHPIPFAQPALVIEAIGQVMAAAGAADHALAACGAAFTQLGGQCQ